jgi:hypothetical protein
MLRTRRQTRLMRQVQAAMTRLDESGTREARRPPVDNRRRLNTHEPLARWENEGGSIADGSPAAPIAERLHPPAATS